MLEQHLVIPLVKLAVAASLASILVRIGVLRRALMRDERTLLQRVHFALGFSAIFGAGVATRIVTGVYQAVDLGLEGSLLAGILGGYVTGLISGVLISIPAMINHEYLSMPLFAAVGVLGGYFCGVGLLGVDDGSFWSQMQAKVLLIDDVVNGVVIKGLVFGAVISWIAVFEGYDAIPTSEGVSSATTRTVVHSSLAVLGLDFVLTGLMFN